MTEFKRRTTVGDGRSAAQKPKEKHVALWTWIPFVYGMVWGAFLLFGGFAAGRLVDSFDGNGRDEWNDDREWSDSDGDRNDGAIERWVRENLPRRGSDEERESVARCFADVAEMLRDGELVGIRDAFSECAAQLQPDLRRLVWGPFLRGVGNLIESNTETDDAEEIAALFERAGRAVGGDRAEWVIEFGRYHIDNERYRKRDSRFRDRKHTREENANDGEGSGEKSGDSVSDRNSNAERSEEKEAEPVKKTAAVPASASAGTVVTPCASGACSVTVPGGAR